MERNYLSPTIGRKSVSADRYSLTAENIRAKLHGLMRKAMEHLSVPLKKGERCEALFAYNIIRWTE